MHLDGINITLNKSNRIIDLYMDSNWNEINKILIDSGLADKHSFLNDEDLLKANKIQGLSISHAKASTIPILVNGNFVNLGADKFEITIDKEVFDGSMEFNYDNTKVDIYDFYQLICTLYDKQHDMHDRIEIYNMFNNVSLIIYNELSKIMFVQIFRWLEPRP